MHFIVKLVAHLSESDVITIVTMTGVSGESTITRKHHQTIEYHQAN